MPKLLILELIILLWIPIQNKFLKMILQKEELKMQKQKASTTRVLSMLKKRLIKQFHLQKLEQN